MCRRGRGATTCGDLAARVGTIARTIPLYLRDRRAPGDDQARTAAACVQADSSSSGGPEGRV
jgi:hypothetical protein